MGQAIDVLLNISACIQAIILDERSEIHGEAHGGAGIRCVALMEGGVGLPASQDRQIKALACGDLRIKDGDQVCGLMDQSHGRVPSLLISKR
jgi:hypothetical protein